MRFPRPFCLAVISAVCVCSCHPAEQVDMIYHNARIYTVDSAFTVAEAMAIKDGKIVAIGKEDDIFKHYSGPVSDAGALPIYPGFIDAHAHFVRYSESLFEAALFGSNSFDEVIDRVRQFASAHPGQAWILGRGWDQNKFPGKAFPDNKRLSEAFPNTPVILSRVDGHALIANAKAMELAGIHSGGRIEGGEIVMKDGKPTGVLVDNAMRLVREKVPQLSFAESEERLAAGQEKCFAQGLTTVTDCGLDRVDIERLDSMQRSGKVRMRVYVMVSDDPADLQYFVPKGPYKTDLLYVKGVKAYADGALGSRGACLLMPYSDRPGWQGQLLSDRAHFDSLAQWLVKTDFQLCTHAIGDSGNRMILQVYNKYLQGKNDKRWRVEHAQVIAPEDFALFGQASIIPSVQPTHATSDMYWAGERLGPERLKGAYANKQLLQQNGWLPLGTDFPVEDISPFKTYLAAVFRVDAKGYPQGGFQMANALTREDAIRGMTIWAAKADFLEKEIGSLEVGKRADFIILDKDLMKIGWDEVLNTKVLHTYSGGKKLL
jgi:predicted amidohydrolase YtcJ